MKEKESIVIKIGKNVMTNSRNRIVLPILKQVVSQVAELFERDIISVLLPIKFRPTLQMESDQTLF